MKNISQLQLIVEGKAEGKRGLDRNKKTWLGNIRHCWRPAQMETPSYIKPGAETNCNSGRQPQWNGRGDHFG